MNSRRIHDLMRARSPSASFMNYASHRFLVIALVLGNYVSAPANAASPAQRQSSEQRQLNTERVQAEHALVVFLGAGEAAGYEVLWDGCGRADCKDALLSQRGVTFHKSEPSSVLGVSRETRVTCGGRYATSWICHSKVTTAALTVNGEKHNVTVEGPVTDSDLVSVASYARSSCFEQALANLSHDRSLLTHPTDVLGLPFRELESAKGMVAGFGRSKVDILVSLQPNSEFCGGYELKFVGDRVY